MYIENQRAYVAGVAVEGTTCDDILISQQRYKGNNCISVKCILLLEFTVDDSK